MPQFFKQPTCMICKKPIIGVAIETQVVLLKLSEDKNFCYNSFDDKFLIPKYIHEDCYWSKMNK